MINYQDIQKITGLSLITSCGCNLNCSYCRIAQAKNDNSVNLQKKTIQALQDGSFLDNISKGLLRLNQSSAQITNLAFWGQEPTLTLQFITKNIHQWKEVFPCWDTLFFSTNGMAHTLDIFDFLVALDTTYSHPMQISIQFSYDGDESTNNIRNGDAGVIYNNIANLIEKCNTYNFQNIVAKFHFHGVISIDLIKQLNTVELIEEYLKNLYTFGCSLSTKNINKKISIDPVVGLALENPVDASAEDGMKLANFLNLCTRIDSYQLSHPYRVSQRIIDRFVDQYAYGYTKFHQTIDEQYQCKNLDDLISKIIYDGKLMRSINHDFTTYNFCGNGIGELKFMYDGTLVNCQNSIFDTDKQFLSNDNSIENKIKHSLTNHSYYINLLTSSDEEINEYFYLFNTIHQTSFMSNLTSVITLMNYLVRTNQIDLSYYDNRKLINHAYKMALLNSCYYNNVIKTGSLILRHSGQIRFFCNGLLDFLDKETGGF